MTATAGAALAAGAVLLLTGCAGQQAPGTALVRIVDNAFEPATLTVQAGTEVRWRNDGTSTHTVTTEAVEIAGEPAVPAQTEPWDSGEVHPGATFARIFDTAGTYVYWCTDHRDEEMVGTIRVEP
jgi:plastocyanin